MKTNNVIFLAFLAYGNAESTWEDEMAQDEYDMATSDKAMCNQVNYMMLSSNNPIDYPELEEFVSNSTGGYFQIGEDCNLQTDYGLMIFPGCDCSDPENYEFANEDVCNYNETTVVMLRNYAEGYEKLKALACGIEGTKDGMDMAKVVCNQVNYMILSENNPTDYPPIEAMDGDFSTVYQNGSDCHMGEDFGSATFHDCDCSDSENYDFLDFGMCNYIKEMSSTEGMPESDGYNKLAALTCGYEGDTGLANFLSVGLMAFCTLLKL
jgi:hypothetical protein